MTGNLLAQRGAKISDFELESDAPRPIAESGPREQEIVYREGGVIPRLQIKSLAPDDEGRWVLRWIGGQGSYQVQSRTRLDAGAWEDCGAQTDQQSLVLDLRPAARFFRVLETRP